MNDNNSFNSSISRIKEVLTKNNSGVIIVPPTSSVDTLCAALSLYFVLEKMGRTSAVIYTGKTNDQNIIGIEKVKDSLTVNGNNLVISFPYADGAIDKVDYQIQDKNFNLIIIPREGYPKINPDQVKFSYTGGNFDFIITLDSPTLNNLGEIYQNNQNQFIGKEIINIDRHLTNNNYGTINLINKTASSISEIIFKVIESLEVMIDKDIATNLYYGLISATNNFTSYSTNADTLEIGAKLLRMGAIKKVYKQTGGGQQSQPFRPFIPFQPKPIEPNKPIEAVEKEPPVREQKNPPQDWLKPKIFKGGGLI